MSPALAAAATVLAAWLAGQSLVSALKVPARIAALVGGLGIELVALVAAIRLTLQAPPARRTRKPGNPTGSGPAARLTARLEHQRRAMYILNAARRITAVAKTGPGTKRGRLRTAVRRERRYLNQHLAARRRRARIAADIDAIVAESGPMLTWVTKLDGRVTPDCAALHGRVFHVDRPPGGLFPGQRHVKCRCVGRAAGR